MAVMLSSFRALRATFAAPNGAPATERGVLTGPEGPGLGSGLASEAPLRAYRSRANAARLLSSTSVFWPIAKD